MSTFEEQAQATADSSVAATEKMRSLNAALLEGRVPHFVTSPHGEPYQFATRQEAADYAVSIGKDKEDLLIGFTTEQTMAQAEAMAALIDIIQLKDKMVEQYIGIADVVGEGFNEALSLLDPRNNHRIIRKVEKNLAQFDVIETASFRWDGSDDYSCFVPDDQPLPPRDEDGCGDGAAPSDDSPA